MSSSRGGVTERSLSRVRLYDPVRVAQPVVSSFFNAPLALYACTCTRATLFTDDARAAARCCLWATLNGPHAHNENQHP